MNDELKQLVMQDDLKMAIMGVFPAEEKSNEPNPLEIKEKEIQKLKSSNEELTKFQEKLLQENESLQKKLLQENESLQQRIEELAFKEEPKEEIIEESKQPQDEFSKEFTGMLSKVFSKFKRKKKDV